MSVLWSPSGIKDGLGVYEVYFYHLELVSGMRSEREAFGKRISFVGAAEVAEGSRGE
jgi:hypothetical protein